MHSVGSDHVRNLKSNIIYVYFNFNIFLNILRVANVNKWIDSREAYTKTLCVMRWFGLLPHAKPRERCALQLNFNFKKLVYFLHFNFVTFLILFFEFVNSLATYNCKNWYWNQVTDHITTNKAIFENDNRYYI